MTDITRFGVSIETDLLASYDLLIGERGYTNRSEALRDLIRDALVQAHLDAGDGTREVMASLTIVYDHHARELTDRLAERQHDRHELVVSTTHVHISHDDCMEVVLLRGPARDVRELADGLLGLKGVKHGKLFVTVAATDITKHSHSHRARGGAR